MKCLISEKTYIAIIVGTKMFVALFPTVFTFGVEPPLGLISLQ